MSQLFFFLNADVPETGGMSGLPALILLYAAIFGIFWFFIMRPQRKKQRAIEEMQNSVEVGHSVLTSAGFYGVVVDIVNDIVVVEFGLNKSIRIPVQKSAIASVAEPDMSVTKETDEE